jgi:hypothetical protein
MRWEYSPRSLELLAGNQGKNRYIIMSKITSHEDPYFQHGVNLKGTESAPLFIVDGCLVVVKSTDLPDICVVTGKIGDNIYISKKMTYAPVWVLALILLSLLIGLLVYVLVKKTGQVGYYISQEAKAARTKLLLINWAIFLAGIGAIFVAVAADVPAIMIAFPVASLVSLIFYFVKIRGIYPGWINETSIGLKGIDSQIMNQLVEASRGLTDVGYR